MKTTSRKRLLISSVAMLLVAMLALGTATFAWFTQNTTTTANGIKAKTVKSSSLVLSAADHDWAPTLTYDQTGANGTFISMLPASSGTGGTTWFTAVSNSETTGAYSEITDVPDGGVAASQAKYVLKQELNLKNDGTEGSITDITIEWSFPSEVADYARVAIVPKTGNIDSADETGINVNTTAGTFANCVYAPSAETYTGLNNVNGTGTSITTKTEYVINVPDLAAQNYAMYDFYVWFEGQDTACVDAAVGQTIDGLEFTISGTPAA